MNLGSPSAPTPPAYRTFLKEFLSDPRVVEIPRVIWWPILNMFILPRRPKVIAKSYQKIWIDSEGSPLTVITRRQVDALIRELQQRNSAQAPTVTYAMTYGEPKLAARIDELQAQGVEKFLVLPLYPQFTATTTGPIYDQYAAIIKRSRNIPDVIINKQYFQRLDYIDALATSITNFQAQYGSADRLLYSFHGIPKRCVERGDPYLDQCRQTAQQVSQQLKLPSERWSFSFQSRFGKAQWLQPYTVDVVRRWAAEGIETIDVVCPVFAADCLETLEEIAVEVRHVFTEAGGKDLRLIPCLNDQPKHIAMMANLVEDIIS